MIAKGSGGSSKGQHPMDIMRGARGNGDAAAGFQPSSSHSGGVRLGAGAAKVKTLVLRIQGDGESMLGPPRRTATNDVTIIQKKFTHQRCRQASSSR